MKAGCVFLMLWAALLLAQAAEPAAPAPTPAPAPPSPSRVIPNATSDAEDQEFHDPFAQEKEAKGPTQVWDPIEPVNRVFFKVNDRFYFWVLKPVATGYNRVAPEPFRESVRRLFVNARYPIRVVNNVLQLKFRGAGIETARFLVNSTVGIGGLFDPAQSEWNLRPHAEDLDQTLGFYRVRPGPYLDWPLFGPSSARSTVGMIGDSFLVPWNYIDGAAVVYGTRVVDTLNSGSLSLGEYEKFKASTVDPYVALRDAYFENRRSLIQK